LTSLHSCVSVAVVYDRYGHFRCSIHTISFVKLMKCMKFCTLYLTSFWTPQKRDHQKLELRSSQILWPRPFCRQLVFPMIWYQAWCVKSNFRSNALSKINWLQNYDKKYMNISSNFSYKLFRSFQILKLLRYATMKSAKM
jgi:hypothetical protein